MATAIKNKPTKQVTFTWEGVNKDRQPVKGEILAANADSVKADLRKKGVIPKKVKKKPQPLFGGAKKITPGDIAVFSRQLATMMSSGVPLIQAFDIVAKGHENPSMKDLLLAIKAEVESGATLASIGRAHV